MARRDGDSDGLEDIASRDWTPELAAIAEANSSEDLEDVAETNATHDLEDVAGRDWTPDLAAIAENAPRLDEEGDR